MGNLHSHVAQTSAGIKGDEYWNPKLYIDNGMGDLQEKIWMTAIFNEGKEGFLCERRRIRGTFLENMELKEFPFDTQVW